jgi:GR25 family glycosyltransferase involved in LPS biosynthesis
MKINFNEIPKFVINLERRPDRLESVKKEFDYMGWSFERFNAVDTNSYEGCAYSHQEVAKIILERGYDYAMVFEDDIFFMPYAKKLIPMIEEELSNNDWSFFHFAPSIHRPLNKFSENLVDLTTLPPKDPSKHRGIFGMSGFILTKKACEYIVKWNTNEIIENSHIQVSIDEFLDRAVYPNMQSFSAKLPLIVQKMGYSDINKTIDSNHYLMTYNWNVYFPDKLGNEYLNYDKCLELRNKNED